MLTGLQNYICVVGEGVGPREDKGRDKSLLDYGELLGIWENGWKEKRNKSETAINTRGVRT